MYYLIIALFIMLLFTSVSWLYHIIQRFRATSGYYVERHDAKAITMASISVALIVLIGLFSMLL